MIRGFRFSHKFGSQFTLEQENENRTIGKQSVSLGNSYEDIYKEVIDSKTFCFFEDIEVMKKNGLAKGGTLDNAIVIKNGKFMNAHFALGLSFLYLFNLVSGIENPYIQYLLVGYEK